MIKTSLKTFIEMDFQNDCFRTLRSMTLLRKHWFRS